MLFGLGVWGQLADQRAGPGKKGLVQASSCQKHPGCPSTPASGCGQAPWKLSAWGRGTSSGRAGLALEEVLVNGEGLLGQVHGPQAPLGSGAGLHSPGSFVDH